MHVRAVAVASAVLAGMALVLLRRLSRSARMSKAQRHMSEWVELNMHAPTLELPPLAVSMGAEHAAVCQVVESRLSNRSGKQWVLRTSQYGHGQATHPHWRVKLEVNGWIARTAEALLCPSGGCLASRLRLSSSEIILVLDAPSFGTTRALAARCGCGLLSSPQVICPQADLGQYLQMIGDGEVSVGVRAQRLDHWLCANRARGLQVVCAFLDFETRALGRRDQALCPMADVMRFFRYGYPSPSGCVLCVTVGLWPGELSTLESVRAAILCEALAAGYEARLVRQWEYRMVALLVHVRGREAQALDSHLVSQRPPPTIAALERTVVVAGGIPQPMPTSLGGVPQRTAAVDITPQGADTGPVVITSSGSLRAVANWETMSADDRTWTARRVAERNAQRLQQMLATQQALT